MEHLAGSELRGRGSATHDEYLAASYVAAQLHAIGLRPGAPDGTYLQQVALPDPLPAAIQQRLAAFEAVPRTVTWNAIGILPGADPELAHQVVLLTAHLDHLGVSRATVTQPSHVYYGADDDASGVTAVLALARNLASGQRPARTVVVACFGSEELGSYGARGFLRQPPVPLQSIVANLEFEMLGRPDPALAPGMLWLTGFERTNLGATLAAHGAPLVADPHPQQGFFQRSDNLTLARDGIVAQTISSFGLHTDYHQPTDTVARIDMNHLIQAITALAPPIRWLANTSWRPQWNPNGKP
ncbi:MAG: M20/M25/M40 family metallo-hydrolase [Acidobacteriota bacterium]|nr:M20/M25/M40 family metallo-hydrolase [Acidobacteriota bacterium]